VQLHVRISSHDGPVEQRQQAVLVEVDESFALGSATNERSLLVNERTVAWPRTSCSGAPSAPVSA
jgi:hypothetical protein